MKVMVVYGTRPEIIKLSATLSKLEKHFNTTTVFTTQNYDKNLSTVFFEDLELSPPNYVLEYDRGTPMSELGSILVQIENLILSERPDCFFILGDTNSCLSAIVAKKHRIPVFHAEAGNRCFDDRVPEEINRRLIDTISDVNMVYSANAKQNLLQEGYDNDKIFVVGSPMKEILNKNTKKISQSTIRSDLSLSENSYIVLSAHRSESVDNQDTLRMIIDAVSTLSEKYLCPVLFPCHPRTKDKIQKFSISLDDNIRLIEPLKFTDYMALQIGAKLVISDSGTITEEASLMNIKAVNLRATHERQEGVDVGVVPMTDFTEEGLVRSAELSLSRDKVQQPACYDNSNFSDAVLQIISGYTQYVRRTIYFEQ